jgi:error-prone DNA polymerase
MTEERRPPPPRPADAGTPARDSIPAVRIGWRHIRGIGERTLAALSRAREEAPFTSVEDVVRRAGLSRAEALQLARAGAFEAFEPGRRRAAWAALRAAGDTLPLAPAHYLPLEVEEMEGDELIFLDYLATGICTHGHPMQHVRERLRRAGAVASTELDTVADGAPTLVAGLVIARQHPQTSKGTVFVLLEDEGGVINVIVPARMYEQNRETVRHSPFLVVEGVLERDGAVVNVVGRRFAELKAPSVRHRSHDFR